MSAPNVAAIDIGTNSIRLLITDARGTQLAREMHITRLGQGVCFGGGIGIHGHGLVGRSGCINIVIDHHQIYGDSP